MKIIIIVVAAATCVSGPARAIDFTAPLLNPDGQAYKKCVKPDPDNPVQCARDGFVDQTLGRFVSDALNVVDQSVTNEGIVSRGLLALKIKDARDIDLTAAERDVIRAALLASYAKAGNQPVAIVNALKVIDPAAVGGK